MVGRDPLSDLAVLRARGTTPAAAAQGIQRQLFSEAIGTTLPITVLRNGAIVDVITVPTELVGT